MDEYKLEVFKDYFDSGEIRKFRELMMYYECAMLEVKTKLDVLNKELALQDEVLNSRLIILRRSLTILRE